MAALFVGLKLTVVVQAKNDWQHELALSRRAAISAALYNGTAGGHLQPRRQLLPTDVAKRAVLHVARVESRCPTTASSWTPGATAACIAVATLWALHSLRPRRKTTCDASAQTLGEARHGTIAITKCSLVYHTQHCRYLNEPGQHRYRTGVRFIGPCEVCHP